MDSPRLPPELITKICENLLALEYRATLAAFLPTSRDMYDLAASLLYAEVTLTRSNASRVFCGLATPPDRLRRKDKRRRSAPDDISWGRFKSRDFYLEWASIYESAPDESLRSRREYLVWPNADADSGEEESDLEEAGRGDPTATGRRRRNTTKLAWPHPTRVSHQRKLRLLGRIKCLHISELPYLDLSTTLSDMARLSLFHFGDGEVRVSIGPRAFWKLVDWKDRHGGRSHPFQAIIMRMKVSDMCIQYPVVDQPLEISYMTSRIVTNDEHLSRGSAVDQYTYLRFRLPSLVLTGFCELAAELCKPHEPSRVPRVTSLTVHNLAGYEKLVDVQGKACRWWFRPCSCQDIYLANPVMDTACYNHYVPDVRIAEARAAHKYAFGEREEYDDRPWLSPKDRARMNWEMIDFDWETGMAQPMRLSARWPDMVEGFWRNLRGEYHDQDDDVWEEMRNPVRFSNSCDAVPCGCCRKGQLSYAESTVG